MNFAGLGWGEVEVEVDLFWAGQLISFGSFD